MASKPIKGNAVQLATFKRWNLESDFGYYQENNQVTKVWCKLCSKHTEKILKDPSIRGQAKKDVEIYAKGTIYVTKHTITRHLSSHVSLNLCIL